MLTTLRMGLLAVLVGMFMGGCQGSVLKQGPAVLGKDGKAIPGTEGEARLFSDRLEFTPQGGATTTVMLDDVEQFQLDMITGPTTKKTTGLILLDRDKTPLIEIIVDEWKAWAGPLSSHLRKRPE